MEKITIDDVLEMVGSQLTLKDGRFGIVHMVDVYAGKDINSSSVFIELEGGPEDGFHYIAVVDGYNLDHRMVPMNRFGLGEFDMDSFGTTLRMD